MKRLSKEGKKDRESYEVLYGGIAGELAFSKSLIHRPKPPRQRILFLGSGQMTAVIASKIALNNKRCVQEKEESGIVDIVVVGKSGSQTLQAMKENGIHVHLQSTHKKYEKYHIDGKDPDFCISFVESHEDIPPANHIIIGVKSFHYDKALYESLQKAIDSSKSTRGLPNILPIQNGISSGLFLRLSVIRKKKQKKEEHQ